MGAEWYCDIHETSQLSRCEKCEMEENNTEHKGCRHKIHKLESELSAARKCVEALRTIKSNTDETDGVFGLLTINHKIAQEALSDYDRVIGGKDAN